ncbi:MAG: serine hydrolase, partial [Brevundimonas sp.]
MRADRRTVLLGVAALTLTACSREVKSAETDLDADIAADDGAVDLDLSDLEARHGGRLGLAIATGGTNAAWRGDERFVYCSTFKMYLAAATLLRVQTGQERLDRAIPVTAADMINHAPT